MRFIWGFLLAAMVLTAPLAVSAATVNFFGPIVPAECNCAAKSSVNPGTVQSAPDWGCVLATVQNLVAFAISIGVIIVVLMMAYAGILWIASPFNPHNREEGRTLLMNAVIGLVITLMSWLIVDFVMKALYNPDAAAGYTKGGPLPWNSILGNGTAGDRCLDITKQPQGPSGGGLTVSQPGQTTSGAQTTSTKAPDNAFTYQTSTSGGDIIKQKGAASAALNTLLSCMSKKVPGDVGQISSISDNQIVLGNKTFAQCAANGCAHTTNSCHYGGSKCTGSSYAVDFGDQNHAAYLMKAANECGASNAFNEGDHVHVSVKKSECGCNEN